MDNPAELPGDDVRDHILEPYVRCCRRPSTPPLPLLHHRPERLTGCVPVQLLGGHRKSRYLRKAPFYPQSSCIFLCVTLPSPSCAQPPLSSHAYAEAPIKLLSHCPTRYAAGLWQVAPGGGGGGGGRQQEGERLWWISWRGRRMEIITPKDYVGTLIELAQSRRAEFQVPRPPPPLFPPTPQSSYQCCRRLLHVRFPCVCS